MDSIKLGEGNMKNEDINKTFGLMKKAFDVAEQFMIFHDIFDDALKELSKRTGLPVNECLRIFIGRLEEEIKEGIYDD